MTPEQTPGRDADVEDAVLDYLGRHPRAADTLDGIVQWWLPQQRYVTARTRIEAVLDRLLDQGTLHLRRLPDGTSLYSLGNTSRTPHA
jgi:hypothetical protein